MLPIQSYKISLDFIITNFAMDECVVVPFKLTDEMKLFNNFIIRLTFYYNNFKYEYIEGGYETYQYLLHYVDHMEFLVPYDIFSVYDEYNNYIGRNDKVFTINDNIELLVEFCI